MRSIVFVLRFAIVVVLKRIQSAGAPCITGRIFKEVRHRNREN